MNNERLKKFTDMFYQLANRYGKEYVFKDFLKLCTISIYNLYANDKELEEDYLHTINLYDKDEQNVIVEMFAELLKTYNNSNEVVDILGPFYEKERLSSKHLGQFFTPAHISDIMAKTTLTDENEIKDVIKKQGYISVLEPSCGAGSLIIAIAKVLKEKGVNYKQELLVTAVDLSEICVYMTYIQLSVYGIPAIVYCGNTLSGEIKFKLVTPSYCEQYKKFQKLSEKTNWDDQKISSEKPVKLENLYKEVTIKGNCQIALW